MLEVIYSAGKVFDGLQACRQAIEIYLSTGDPTVIDSRHDLALLQDLKQLAEVVIEHAPKAVDANFIIKLNATMTRSASIEPGVLRRDDDYIGVNTVFGRHEPEAIMLERLSDLVNSAMSDDDHARNAATLFLAIAKAQPFKDGNKRSAIFAANAVLMNQGIGATMPIPFSDSDESVAKEFNLKLARAYRFDEDEAVIQALIDEMARH